MGLLDRLKRTVTGVGGALWAPVGFVKDVATAPFSDDEIDGFFNTIYRHATRRGGDFFESGFGPNSGLGAAVNAIPTGLRDPASDVIGGVGAGLETAYREGVAEPLSTLTTVRGLGGDDPVSRVMGMLDPGNWQEAYRLAQDRSPGQAMALVGGTRDLTDPEEVANFMATDGYEVISGTLDAVTRFTLSPEIVAGKALRIGRMKFRSPITSQTDIAAAADSVRLHRFNKALEGKTASEIRDTYFANHSHGGVISSLLAEAGDTPTRMATLRGLMGERQQIQRLRETRADLAGQLERATAKQNRVVMLANDDPVMPTLWNNADEIANAKAEVDALYDLQARSERALAAFESAPIREVPRDTLSGRVRTSITRSDFYQKSPMAKPLRVTFGMNPHAFINVHDQSGDVHLQRMLRGSRLDIADQDTFRSDFLNAVTPRDRELVLVKAENAAVNSIAREAGMTTEEIRGVLASAQQGRYNAARVLNQRAYDADGRSRIRFEDEGGTLHEIEVPVLVTQEQNFLPVANMAEVRRAAGRIQRFKTRHPHTPTPSAYLDSFYKVWRPSVLLRAGWPIRVVGDEQLRIAAKIGALTQVKNLTGAARANIRDRFDQLPEFREAIKHYPKEGRQGLKRELGDLSAQRGKRWLEVDGNLLEGPFGAPGDADNIMRQMASSRASWQKIIGQYEDTTLQRLRQVASGEYSNHITPDSPSYAAAWEWAVNKQIGQDQMSRQLLHGRSVDEVVEWLRATPDGQSYARRIPERKRNLQAWVEQASDQVERYTLGSDELKALALSRKVSADDLNRIAPGVGDKPIVHGAILQDSLQGGPVNRLVRSISTTAFKWLGQQPTDVLSRNRFFDHMYRAEATRLTRLHGGKLDQSTLTRIEHASREYALRETRDLLYDLAESSELAEMLRHVVPFYSAWQEVITRWAGLAVENPAFVGRMRQVWSAPDKAGLITDENGREVEWGVEYEEGERGSERYLTIPVPEWAQKTIPGLRGQGEVAFNKKSFNMVLQGAPGFGPVVQIPVNEIVKNRPELEDSLSFVLPYGVTQEIRDMLLPATAKRAFTRTAGEEDRQYGNSVIRIFNDMIVDYNLGKRDTQPTWDEAKKRADSFWNMRIAASWLMPAAPSFRSPYQFYIDAYRQARERVADNPRALADEEGNDRSADEWFLDTFGEEYFVLTQSLSKSMDGIPPTLEGARARKKYEDLIRQHPEMGGLIIGKEGAGEFAGAVYDAQFAAPLAPGSGKHQRESFSFEEAVASPQIRLGWIKFSRAMDLIDAERVRRGLPNFQVRAAQDLATLKRAVVQGIAQAHPEWFEEYGTTDMLKWDKRLEAFSAITQDKRLQKRDDIRGLTTYLQARELILGELGNRKAKTLTASANRDLAILWDTITQRLVESNLAFGDLYHRWLENDPVTRPVLEPAA